MQEAINLFNSKNYEESLNQFSEYYKTNQEDSECLKYIYLCSKNLKNKKEIQYFNQLIELYSEQNKFYELSNFVEKEKLELNLKNKINYITSLFENGEVKKSNLLFLDYLELFLENKNYIAVNNLIRIEKNIMKFNPKLELIKLIFWSDLCYYDEIFSFLNEIENIYTKNWKSFRDHKTDKLHFFKKVINILDSIKTDDARIYKQINFIELKYSIRKFSLQEKLEYIILNIEDPVKQSYVLNQLDEEDRDEYIELIRSQEMSSEQKRQLAEGFFEFEKNRIQIVQNNFDDEVSEILKFDQLPTHPELVHNEKIKSEYILSKDEVEFIKKIKAKDYEDPETFIIVLIENSFLKAAMELSKELEDHDLKTYYQAEIYFRLESWSELIDLCMKNYKTTNSENLKIYNYFIGMAYLEKNENALALKYFNKVLAEDPGYRSVIEKVELAKNK